ncbi:MAG: hypothetical protein M0024_10945 [Nitrospiraceae bacterium]|nr:hypothetical protein [Nitrospiraceae bacterium]
MNRINGLLAALILLSACGSAGVRQADRLPPVTTPPDRITLNVALLRESDYIDIVYENGAISYAGYLKKEDMREHPPAEPCRGESAAPSRTSKGIWIWDMRKIAGHEKSVTERLAADGFNRLYVQIQRDPETLVPLLKEAAQAGIEVFAVDGDPDHIINYQPLIDDIMKIRRFNNLCRDACFAGIQFDVEPYLRKDFNLRKQYYADRYLRMARDLRQAAGPGLRLSFALPFWFDTLSAEGKPLSFQVTDIADEVAIMSYRTDFDEMVQSAIQELCYAATAGKPVFLGLETTKLPDEEHVILDAGKAMRDGATSRGETLVIETRKNDIRASRTYTVRAERLTFHGKKEELVRTLNRKPPFRSFSGYIVHSYEGLYE